MVKATLVFMLVLTLVVPLTSYADDENPLITDPAFIWTAGQIEPSDNSVFYNLYIVTGPEMISDIVVSGMVPEGATFVADFWKPATATFVGEADGTVTWQLPELGSNTIAGPFTFHVTFENADAEDFAPPAHVDASVTWSDGTVAAELMEEETLMPLEDMGTITIEPAGTTDLVPVGDTGAWILVPENAVAEAVTLTLTRLPISTEPTDLPTVEAETWWCGQYSLTADKDVTFSQPITLILPIKRALTPGIEIPVFGMSEGGEWMVMSDGSPETGDMETAFAYIDQYGVAAEVELNAATLGSAAHIIAVGISFSKREESISGTYNTPQKGGEWF